MMNRLLSTTAALSVALGTLQPLPLLAQEKGNAPCITGADCEPVRKGKKPKAEAQEAEAPAEEEQQPRRKRAQAAEEAEAPAEEQAQPRRQRQQAAEEAAAGENPQLRRAQRQQNADEQAEPEGDAPAAAAAEEDADQPPRAQRQRNADQADRDADAPAAAAEEDDDQPRRTQRQRNADRDAEAAEEPRAAEREPAADEERPEADPLRRALRERQGEQEDAPRAAEEDRDRPARADSGEGDDDLERAVRERRRDRAGDEEGDADQPRRANRNRQADETEEAADEPTRRQRREAREESQENNDAVNRLSDVLSGSRDADGLAAAAAAAAGVGAADNDRDARTTRITEEDSRSSNEEFDSDPVTTRRDDDNDDDDDDGLSNLQKFGLLALGGLAVGALLNNGDEVVSNSGDRVIVQQPDGTYTVLKDDDTLLRRPGSEVRTQSYDDGSTRSIVERGDGSQIVTIRDASGRVLRRSRIDPEGREVLLIDDLAEYEEINVADLPEPAPVLNFRSNGNREDLREALASIEQRDFDRSFSLRQIRDYREVRDLAPSIDVDNITFASGSAAIDTTEAEALANLGDAISEMIADKPNEIFLIEGHTDAVGSAAANLALSDRRAESVALALTEYFDVPPENLVVQGYGESDLRVETDSAEQRNRRVAVRLITPLLQQASAE